MPALRHTDWIVRLAKAILLRILYGVLSLLFISFITFIAGTRPILGYDAADILVGEKGGEEARIAKRVELGLDRPVLVQFGRYVISAAQFDLGSSWYGTREPVSKMIAERAPFTVSVASLAILLAAIVGISLGTVAAVYKSRAPDASILTLSTLGVTIPNFVLLPVLVYFFANNIKLLPGDWHAAARENNELVGRILPVLVLSARPMALLTRLTRATMIDTMQQEFIKTATAKGMSASRLIFTHALRNAILPVVTAIGVNFGFLLTGSFVIETAYSLPGLGSLAIDAIKQQNTPVIQGTVLVTGAMFIAINLIVDMFLPLLDPRIREAQV